MKVVQPVSITSTELDSSTVSLPDTGDPSIWAVGTAYVIDDEVYDDIDFFVYVAVAAQTGNQPSTDDGTNWKRTTATNRYKMFNAIVQDQTEVSAVDPAIPEIEVEITPNKIVTAVCLLNVDAETVQVVMDDPSDGEVYNSTQDLTSTDGILEWYNWYFDPIVRRTTVLFNDLGAYYDATLTITITGAVGGTVKCGECVLGPVFDMGDSQYGATFGIIDFSKKTTDETTGLVTITPGPTAVTADVDVVTDTQNFTIMKNFLESIVSAPVVWIPDENREGTIVYGYYREFDVVIQNYSFTRAIIEIEGLV